MRRALPPARWLGLLAALGLALVACVRTPAPDPPPQELERLDLVAQVPIAAAQLELVRPPGTTFVAARPLRPGLLVRAAARGDRIRLAWVGEAGEAGPQVRIELHRSDDATVALETVTAAAFAGSADVDLGPGIFAWRAGGAVSDDPLLVPTFDHAGAAASVLLAEFADHRLGDLNADGLLDVRDALRLLELLRGGGWTDFTLYHGDLDADDVSDLADLRLLLDRLVDDDLPARLHVKPRSVSFLELDPATDRDAIVLVANQGARTLDGLAWTPPPGVAVDTDAARGLEGQAYALRLTLPEESRRGWAPGFLRVALGAGDAVDVRVGHLVVLIAGQSNAVGQGAPLAPWPELPVRDVRTLGNDYVWRDAAEPLDDATGQLDPVSLDASARYSLGTRLGNLLHVATGFTTYLIPTAKGASRVAQWLRPVDPLDRGTLFGSANLRAQVSAALEPGPWPLPAEGGPVNVLLWYQGESDNLANQRPSFVLTTHQVMDAFVAELGVPVVYVQLASQYGEQLNVQSHAVAELQRRMETGSGDPSERAGYHMVVTFDLPRSDRNHLSAFGQRVLAERVERAIRQHVLGEAIDGTGPRLLGLQAQDDRVRVRTTHPLADRGLDAGLFTVYDGPPSGSLDDVERYGDNAIPITHVERDPDDATAVLLTLDRVPTATPHVRYMARSLVLPSTREPSAPEMWEAINEGAVVDAAAALPLPAFGPLPAATAP